MWKVAVTRRAEPLVMRHCCCKFRTSHFRCSIGYKIFNELCQDLHALIVQLVLMTPCRYLFHTLHTTTTTTTSHHITSTSDSSEVTIMLLVMSKFVLMHVSRRPNTVPSAHWQTGTAKHRPATSEQ